ncbi:hypothetical protein AB0H82_26110 [Streptomyces sp. NPDC050732]|uniref:hypothetical protein n=1 Tax=Streptomyces sp. NPDC050732 TaxID=3154632 RepID=UPI003437BD12
MEITDAPAADIRQVRITAEGGRAVLRVDGVDHSRAVSAYTIRQLAGEPAEVVLQLARGRADAAFEGYARVAVGVPYEPGDAAAQFLSAIDARLLEKSALARPDLDGGEHGFTKAVLAQLGEWARGEFSEAQEVG